MKTIIKKVKKRDGRIVPFKISKIERAIWQAAKAAGGKDRKRAKYLTSLVIKELEERFNQTLIPEVEQIQDIVERVLLDKGHEKTHKAFTLYRDLHTKLRDVRSLVDSDELIKNYLDKSDWRVKENANMTYSLQGLNNHVASMISANFWLNQIYPREVRKAHLYGAIHIHDLALVSAYCTGWDLKDLLIRGFGGVRGKINSRPAKHFSTALGQLVNFFYTLQGEIAGAVAVSNFDTYLSPFIHYDGLSYKAVKQAMQEFLYNMGVPTRVGFQNPFSNVTLDLVPPKSVGKEAVIIGGKPVKAHYKDFQKEMDMFNKAFAQVMAEGDAQGRVFTFPIPTYSVTRDFDWDNPVLEPIFEMTRRYGVPYWANFVNSDMKPEDVRSMCCHLRLSNKELRKRGGLFAAHPLTGSLGVVTINLPRIGFLSKNKREFFQRLNKLMEIARDSLLIKRKAVEEFTEQGLYPYCRYYLSDVKKRTGKYWTNHFNTIGINGMNEALLNLTKKSIATREGKAFALEMMEFMRKKILEYQKKTDQLFNLEATPAEGTSYRFARIDKERFKDIIVANEKDLGKDKIEPFYTNSTHLPVDYTSDIFEALEHQDKLQCAYNGGCVEKGNKVLTDRGLLKIEEIVENLERLKPLKVLSYNPKKKVSEWDRVINAVKIDVSRHNKIRVKGERNLDITTSDWHPFFVLKRIKPKSQCPICNKRVKSIKAFATHLKNSLECRKEYRLMEKYKVVEKRADELKIDDYILQNSNNLYPNSKNRLTEDLAWLFGFFIGDGCISEYIDNRGGNNLKKYKVRFFSEHQKALKKLKGILAKYFQVKARVIKNDKRSKALREVATNKKKMADFLFKYGFKNGKKVYNVFVPQRLKESLTRNNIFSFLCGLIDSDGCVNKKDGYIEYYTVSPKLADDLLEICTRAGLLISKKKKKVHRSNEVDIYRLRIPAYQATKIRNKLVNMVSLARIKKNLSNRKRRHLPVVRVKEVSKVEVGDSQFYDLTTKKNHNYLAGKGSLVFIHNTVFHGFLGESLPDTNSVKNLIRKISQNYHLPYFTLTPTFSICPTHGYLKGEHQFCPKCKGKKTRCEVYSRVVGYLRPVDQWNPGKQAEFYKRREYKIK